MQQTKSRVELKAEAMPDEVRPFDKGKVEIYTVGGRVVGKATFEPGWKWSECVGPIAKTERCMAEHVGYQISGTMHIKSEDGNEYDIHAGDTFYLPPGHDGWVVGDEAVVCLDFQGMAEYAKKKETPTREGRRH